MVAKDEAEGKSFGQWAKRAEIRGAILKTQ
jgi:hypothetical protein